MTSYDLVICGGGLSGWSLAAQLADQGWDRPVLLVNDPLARPSPVAWAFWSTAAGPSSREGLLAAAASRSFGRVRVHANGEPRELPLGRYRYHVVRRPDLLRAARSLVDRCPAMEVRSGHVQSIRSGGDHAVVTVDGEPVRCSWAFDSVSGPARGPADAWLAFTGWDVRTAGAVFDPEVPVLFDFRTPQGAASRFVYVLPQAPDRALVEVTEFVPGHGAPSDAREREHALARYLAEVAGADDYETLGSESAVLPLRARALRRRVGRVFAIGVTAGLLKASTGYAYQRIQSDSARIAASLVHYGQPLRGSPRRRRHRVLDAVLLDVLDRGPAQLEVAFDGLFGGNPVERVLSFLDETSTIGDDLRIMASLRPAPYLRALALLPLHRARSRQTPGTDLAGPATVGRRSP